MTIDDLRVCPWQNLLANISGDRECRDYMSAFFKEAAECVARNDEKGKDVYNLLGCVAGFEPNFSNAKDPFGPWYTKSNGSRSPTPGDLSEEQLNSLEGILEEIQDPEMKARVGDLLWICKRSHKAAISAVEAYLKSSIVLERMSADLAFLPRLGRAVQLAALLGRKKPLHLQTLKRVEELLAKYEDMDGGLLCSELMAILIGHDHGDSNRYAPIAEKIAICEETACHWDFAQTYWSLAAVWFRQANKTHEEQRVALRAAECWASKAEALFQDPHMGAGPASEWMGRAVRALRESKANKERIDQAHARLLEFQDIFASTGMTPLKINENEIPGFKEERETMRATAIGAVKGRSLRDAIFRLALLTKPVNPDDVRAEVLKNADEFIFTSIFGAEAMSETGRVEQVAPPLHVPGGKPDEEAILQTMFTTCRESRWNLVAEWALIPGIQQIFSEHALERRDLAYLVIHHPFVPPGREGVYLEGIRAGFFGDWLTATHLLIPQLENSIRTVLTERGVITSKLDADKTQDERDLGWLLTHEKTKEIFGEAMVFNLRGILIERFGYNLRNNMSHGLMSHEGFYSPGSVYLWWLTLRLLCIVHEDFARFRASNRKPKIPQPGGAE